MNKFKKYIKQSKAFNKYLIADGSIDLEWIYRDDFYADIHDLKDIWDYQQQEIDKLKAERSELIETVSSNMAKVMSLTSDKVELKAENEKLKNSNENLAEAYNKALDRNIELYKKYEPEKLDY